MADSFGASRKVGVLSVHEAGPEVRFVMGPEYFSPACVAGSRRVLDVQEFSESQDGRWTGQSSVDTQSPLCA